MVHVVFNSSNLLWTHGRFWGFHIFKEVIIAIGLISGIGGQACMHHGTTIEIGWFWVQLGEIMEGFGNIPLFVTNEDYDPPQLKLQDVVGSSLVWKG
jgi:hypothetical protein